MLSKQKGLFQIMERKNMIGLIHDNLLLFMKYTREEYTVEKLEISKFSESKEMLYITTHMDHIPV